MMKRIGAALFFILGLSVVAPGQISGKILDESGSELVGATIFLFPDSLGEVSGIDGSFSFTGLQLGTYQLEITYLGYNSELLEVEVEDHSPKEIKVRLEPIPEVLNTILVTDEHAKQESSLGAEHFSERLIEENLQGTFAKSIDKLPGISSINVGVGIAKPVIRGLSSNRIIVNQQGIKQESHQWGADHGLEVDQFDVERVEIIKGPASLQYGSDGLGGVINILPGRVPPRNSITGSVLGIYKTNNQHIGGSAKVAANVQDIFLSARYSYQNFGDYRVPAEQFDYNSFTLPILNNTLKNTAGREENLSLAAGVQGNWGISRIIFTHYGLEAGLFSGAVGIPRSYTLTDDGNNRDIDVPKQAVDHYRVSFHQALYLGEDHFDFNVAYQRNLRLEFSFPEFHSIPSSMIDPGNTLALQFELVTLSANAHYEHHLQENLKSVFGINIQQQMNERTGFEFLLPDFKTFRAGGFGLLEWELSDKWITNGGLRLDYARNTTEFYRQWVWNSNEQIIDSLIAPATDDPFFNWSASIGSSWILEEGKWVIKTNLGKSFRVPYPAETVSNGIHHGTFRHEVGTPDLSSEHGYQLDAGLDMNFGNWKGGIAGYFNYFENYIYLGPTFPAQFSPLPEAGQIFQYRQDDAIYTGFELYWNWQALSSLRIEQVADFVQSYNPETGLALPFTPQPSLKTNLRYTLLEKGRMEEWFIEAGHQWYLAAEGPLRIDRSERPTPGFQLWELKTGITFKMAGQSLQFIAQAQNLFNTSYLNHLSRYRLINIPEQGRNVVLTLKVPFFSNL